MIQCLEGSETVGLSLISGMSWHAADHCADEFLIHAVDVEGKAQGIETELAGLLGNWGKIPVTYAGGVGNFSDLDQLKRLGKNRLNVTIGSALDLFGGDMAFEEVLEYCNGTGKKAGTCQ